MERRGEYIKKITFIAGAFISAILGIATTRGMYQILDEKTANVILLTIAAILIFAYLIYVRKNRK